MELSLEGGSILKYSGYHLVIDLFGCNFDQLENTEYIIEMLKKLAEILDTTIITKAFHKFYPQGFSGALIISESHITIHTWPEDDYTGIDIFTCSKCFDSGKVVAYLKENLIFKKMEIKEILRGKID
mgnify:CR=1 FL=1|jgi:S-adenosylmethionine decarboxylase